ncbi:uncharacterized protein KD926_011764 [Aspergillus affinis]|uniref:uncharacterized protein n=1 Tax=Aspergillus affinis TaxID=1070780 RepID=UPI0022FE0446|nr:uncharacterized protein KD926_011764 [Aspergillus affinis]KAI9044793.1 hypothetical protein KD926_011764 [Aspergillus affinis]
MSYSLLPDSPPPTKTKSHPNPYAHFITHHLPLLLILSFAFLLTLTILLLLLPITGPNLLGTARTCPSYPLWQKHPAYILSSSRENPLNEAQTQNHHPQDKDQDTGKDKTWENTVIPPTSGGGIFASHLDVLTEADVQRVGANKTHSGVLDQSYRIVMFHQLHCLGALRGKIFPDAVHEHKHSGGEGKSTESEKEKQIKEQDHLGHCFKYILQVRLYHSLLPSVPRRFALSPTHHLTPNKIAG